jgi:hypothetical protein
MGFLYFGIFAKIRHYPLPVVNETKNKKPKLTENQIERVKKYYIQDVNLYNSISDY